MSQNGHKIKKRREAVNEFGTIFTEYPNIKYLWFFVSIKQAKGSEQSIYFEKNMKTFGLFGLFQVSA
jgi:hypothetical protein